MRLVGIDGRSYPLETETTIGRAKDNMIVVDDESVSDHHAAIRTEGSAFILHDLGSTNGTFLNDSAISEPRVLKPGDQILIGGTTFRLEDQAESPAAIIPERPGRPAHESITQSQVIIREARDQIREGDDIVAILGVILGGAAILLVAAGLVGTIFAGVGVICLGLALLFGVTGAALSAIRLKSANRSLAIAGLVLSLIAVMFTLCIGCMLAAAGLSVLGALLELSGTSGY